MNHSPILALLAGLVLLGHNSAPKFATMETGNQYAPDPANGSTKSLPDINDVHGQINAGENETLQGVSSEQHPLSAKLSVEGTDSYIYPNPNSGYFVVQLPLPIAGKKGMIEVYNSGFNKVYSSDFIPENGDKITVELTGLTPGLYFLSIKTTDDRVMSKFLLR